LDGGNPAVIGNGTHLRRRIEAIADYDLLGCVHKSAYKGVEKPLVHIKPCWRRTHLTGISRLAKSAITTCSDRIDVIADDHGRMTPKLHQDGLHVPSCEF